MKVYVHLYTPARSVGRFIGRVGSRVQVMLHNLHPGTHHHCKCMESLKQQRVRKRWQHILTQRARLHKKEPFTVIITPSAPENVLSDLADDHGREFLLRTATIERHLPANRGRLEPIQPGAFGRPIPEAVRLAEQNAFIAAPS